MALRETGSVGRPGGFGFEGQQSDDLPAPVQGTKQLEVDPDQLVGPVKQDCGVLPREPLTVRQCGCNEPAVVEPSSPGQTIQRVAVVAVQRNQIVLGPRRFDGACKIVRAKPGVPKLAKRAGHGSESPRAAGNEATPAVGSRLAEDAPEQRVEQPCRDQPRLPFSRLLEYPPGQSAEVQYLGAQPNSPRLDQAVLNVLAKPGSGDNDQRPSRGPGLAGLGDPLDQFPLQRGGIEMTQDLQRPAQFPAPRSTGQARRVVYTLTMRGIRTLSWLSIFLLASIAPASGAPELWLLAEPSSPVPGQRVVVRLMQGEPFEGRETALDARNNGRLQRVWKGGRENLTAGFAPRKPGVQLVAYEEPRRYCKALVVVGEAPHDDPIRYSEVGHRLEIVPQTDPVVLKRSAGELEVQVLFEQEPLAGVIVFALPQGAPRDGRRTAVTDEIGLVRFALDRPGTWMVRVVHTGAEARATLILQVGA